VVTNIPKEHYVLTFTTNLVLCKLQSMLRGSFLPHRAAIIQLGYR